ncbi:MAG: S-layer homology domain-containing protein [Clostridia bacterium]|nr:S-layer homology domain-containing protein [Clostridia bacterium]
MNKLQRLISSVAAAAITASMFASTAVASIPSDVAGTDYESEATVLGALDIMVGDAGTGTFRPEDTIIRSEVVKVGVALMGLSGVANSSSGTVMYPDLDTTHWANGFINTATSQKLVIGDDTGLFRPDDKIKYSEAVAILVRALGYEPQAESKGGYPFGYIATANSIGLSKGVSASAEKLISRGEVARLAYNALNINTMEQVGFGDNVNYEVTDKTLLTDKLDAELVSGKVEAVGSSALAGSDAVEKNQIKIGGKVYASGKADTRNLLGFTVDAYVSKKSGGKAQTLLAAIPSEGKNSILTVGADAIDKIEKSSGAATLHYYADEENTSKASKASIEGSALIMYNGKAADMDKLTAINSGSIVMLDSDGNGKYDVVFVNETVNYVVDEVYGTSNRITDKYGMGTLELDTEAEDKTVILEKGNESIKVSDLKEWDVITVTQSSDKELIYATVVHNSIQGKISEKDDEAVYIDGKKYKIASNYTETLTLGTEGTFYLDYEGKIAAFDGKTVKSDNYAFMESAAMSTGMDKILQLKLFTKDGKLEIVDSAKKVRVNAKTGLTPEQALAEIGTEKQLITFETNSKGAITRINTHKTSDSIDENSFVMNLKEDNVVYRASSSKLIGSDMNVTVGADTLIFDIPEGGSTDEYSIRDKGIFADGGLYNIAVYDMTEDYKAGVIIVTNSQAKADEESAIAVIDKITKATNADGDPIHKVYALSGGKEISFVSSDDKVFEKAEGVLLGRGDIIQYRTNSKDEIDAVTVLFDASKKEEEFKNKISDNLTTVYGKITKKFSDSINVQVADGKAENYATGEAVVYVYDSGVSKKYLTVGDAADLVRYEDNGARVFIRIFKDKVQEIVVVK